MLRNGKSTPDFVESMLSVFGANLYGEPNYRLIWSERKMLWFGGQMCPEYTYLPYPGWVLEAWTSPEKDAGTPEQWERTTHGLLGPYPSRGTYNFVKQYPADWQPTEENLRIVCIALGMSKDVTMAERVNAIREQKEKEAARARQQVADAIVELQDSASRGLIQQAVSGPKNNFRTTDDFERDQARVIAVQGLPLKGGKLIP